MTSIEISEFAQGYFDRKKGYSVEVDDYINMDNCVYFSLRVLKKGAFKASEKMKIILKDGHLPSVQMRSQVEKFSASVINNLI